MDANTDLNCEELSSLNVTIVDQQSLEARVEKALDDAVADHSRKQQVHLMKEDAIDSKQEIKKFIQKKGDLELRLQGMKKRFTDPRNIISVEKQIKETQKLIESWQKKAEQLSNNLTAYENGTTEEAFLPKEVEQDEKKSDMIKTGEMTPFGTITDSSTSKIYLKPSTLKSTKTPLTDFEKYLSDQMDRQKKNIKRNNKIDSKPKRLKEQPSNSRKSDNVILPDNISRKRKLSDSAYEPKNQVQDISSFGSKSKDDSDYDPSEYESDSDEEVEDSSKQSSSKSDTRRRREKDDGNLCDYRERIAKWKKQRLHDVQEGVIPLNEEFHEIGNGFKIPAAIWESLFKFQRTGVQWLWELHSQRCGGIMGDEMGLGKTIQVVAFLAGLSVSRRPSSLGNWTGLGPVLVLCPATVLQQWLKEFHKWRPQFRVAILHGSGSFTGKRSALIHNIISCNGILLTSYTGARAQLKTLIQYQWHYLILDEGHHIRNPTAQITVAVKRIDTPHRLILSGSPIQNSLKELWSLFDFIFPGKLGTLPVFMEQFAVPITQGGYSNANKLEVQTAFRCATVLRDTISPFLLRRMKADVRNHLSLPDKNEQVLFCGLSEEQRNAYRSYLDGYEVKMILRGQLMAFVGLITLRKICNHPDIHTGGPRDPMLSELQPEMKNGYWKRSGKMVVLQAILKLWSKQGHRVLLFTQSRQMLQILCQFMHDEQYTYFKMDGSTTVGSRQLLIDKFNNDPSIFVFILTTRVGGLGVNLTGADRVIIFDPDWNPSTDMQARERAWRIGQLRHVTIYRLLTAGTIEEKIYHRQLFKQFITNRVLKDPKQQRFFKTSDLNELFTLTDGDKVTETSALFAGTGSEIKPKKRTKRTAKVEDSLEVKRSNTEAKALKEMQEDEDDSKEVEGESEYEQQIRKLAKLISKRIVEQSKLKNKKSKKGKKVEGSRIQNLVKKRTFKESGPEDNVSSVDQDEYVLKKLFRKSAVHSAYRHDTIVDGLDPDHLLLEAEANRVAQDALRKVRASRLLCSRPQVAESSKKKRTFGVVTNNRIEASGSNCGPQSSKEPSGNASFTNSGLLSSAQLLLRMRQRNVILNKEEDASEVVDEVVIEDENVELLSDVRNFVAFQSMHNGKASTQELLDKFKDRLPPEKSLIFKRLLNSICDFSKDSEGNGIWQLMTDFR